MALRIAALRSSRYTCGSFIALPRLPSLALSDQECQRPSPFFSPVSVWQTHREEKNGLSSTYKAGEVDIVISATADGAAWEAPRAEFGSAARAAAAEVQEGQRLGDVTVDRQDRPRVGLDVDDVVVGAAVLVRVFEGPPPRSEGQAAVPAGQISEVSHATSMALVALVRCADDYEGDDAGSDEGDHGIRPE